MPLAMEVGLGPGNVVLDADPAPKGEGHSPPFWPMYCGQTAAWTKMPLGTEVGLCPGHIVLDDRKNQWKFFSKRGDVWLRI